MPVPRLWPSSTIVCLGGGYSLTPADVDACRTFPVIAINNAITLAPWAAVQWIGDEKWARWHPDRISDTARIFTLDDGVGRLVPTATVLGVTGQSGVELNPAAVRSGGHSGYAVINAAVHLGASKIVLLGYDMQATITLNGDIHHHFGDEHPDGSHPRYHLWRGMYQDLWLELNNLGISLVNASRVSSLTVPRQSLASALASPFP